MSDYFRLGNKICTIAGLIIGLGGCASDPNSLRTSPAGTVEFVSPESLTKVFQSIKDQAEKCNPGNYKSTFNVQLGVTPVPYTSTTTFEVKSNISADRSTAEIFFIGTNSVVNNYMIIDLGSAAGGGTKVVTSYKYPIWRNSAAAVEEWSKGDFRKCWFPF